MCPYMSRKGVFSGIVFVTQITVKTGGGLRTSCHYIPWHSAVDELSSTASCIELRHNVEGDLRSTVVCIKMRDTYIDAMRRGAEMD